MLKIHVRLYFYMTLEKVQIFKNLQTPYYYRAVLPDSNLLLFSTEDILQFSAPTRACTSEGH